MSARREVNCRVVISRLAFVPVLFYLFLGSNAWTDKYRLLEEGLFLLGTFCVGIGVVGRVWSLSYISGKKGFEVVAAGPYSLCRNPLYLFSLLGGMGVAFCTETITIPVLTLAGFALIYSWTIKREESLLRALFGPAYDAYCQKVTTRLWPSRKAFSENVTLTTDAVTFRKSLTDLTLFIVLIGLIDFLENLHDMGILPTLFRLY